MTKNIIRECRLVGFLVLVMRRQRTPKWIIVAEAFARVSYCRCLGELDRIQSPNLQLTRQFRVHNFSICFAPMLKEKEKCKCERENEEISIAKAGRTWPRKWIWKEKETAAWGWRSIKLEFFEHKLKGEEVIRGDVGVLEKWNDVGGEC